MGIQKLRIKSLRQFFRLFFWITFAVVTFFSVLTFWYLYKNINDAKTSTLDSVTYTAQRIIEEHIGAIYSAETEIIANLNIQNYIISSDSPEAEQFKIQASDFIRTTVAAKGTGFDAALFSDKSGKSIACTAENSETEYIEGLYAKYAENNENDLFMYRMENSLFPEFYICHFEPVIHYSTKEVGVYRVGTAAVVSKINTYELEKNASDNAILSVECKNVETGNSYALIDTAGGNNYRNGTVLVKHISGTDWYLYAELFKMTGISIFPSFFILAVILLLLLAFFNLSFKVLLDTMVDNPITKLSAYLEDFKLSGKGKVKTEGTVGVEEFDKILNHINMLFTRVDDQAHIIINTQQKMYEQELFANEQTLYMNQMQINPHFLFNTLSTIAHMSIANGMDEVALIAQNMADIFRYSIEGDYKSTIDEEIYIVLKYLKIFNSRYGREFSCKLDVEDELYEYPILKMIIQPLVENSFKHGGIANKEEPVLKISAYRQGDGVIISVYDNGNGIDAQRLEEINADLGAARTERKKGIGLLNINKRLKICYGKDSGLQIKSEYGKYTEVLIIIK